MESKTIRGQLLVLDDQHKIAIHSRDGELWVAEFQGERAELVRAAAWFRLHYGIGRTSFSLRRALRSAVPLSNEMEVAIEKLHRLEQSRVAGLPRAAQIMRTSGNLLASITYRRWKTEKERP
jgi:hypothetical protein